MNSTYKHTFVTNIFWVILVGDTIFILLKFYFSESENSATWSFDKISCWKFPTYTNISLRIFRTRVGKYCYFNNYISGISFLVWTSNLPSNYLLKQKLWKINSKKDYFYCSCVFYENSTFIQKRKTTRKSWRPNNTCSFGFINTKLWKINWCVLRYFTCT